MAEIWDVYDMYRRRTGKQIMRGKELKLGDYHIVIHLCLFNKNGEMLIQQRQSDRESWANLWDVTVGGSALAGETSQQAAEREMIEEIGFAYDFSETRPVFTDNFNHGFDDYYVVEKELDISTLSMPTEEVQQIKWASKDEIIDGIRKGTFIPYYESLIHLLFDKRNGNGSRQVKN